jgi:AcrR family transcriptional regulator
VADGAIDARLERGADTRQRIIAAAWSAIAEHGIAKLTTREVAKRAGVTHGMCYYHFATKEDMVLAVVEYARHYWIVPLERLVSGSDPPQDKLESLVRWMAEPATREVMRVHLQLVSQSEFSEALRDRMAAEYARWHAGYVGLFQQLEEAGLLREDVDPGLLGVGFATLADGLVDQQSLDPAVRSEAIMRAFLSPFVPSLALA